MSEVVYLQNKRISFAHIAKPNAPVAGGRETYSCDFLMAEADPEWQKIMTAVQKVLTDEFKQHADAVMQQVWADKRSRFFGWGQEKIKKDTMQPYPEYEGNVFAGALNERQPQIIRPDGTPVAPSATMELNQLANAIYSGCFVNAAIDIWAQNNSSGRGVRAKLLAIQFAADGEALGGSDPDASGMFGAVAGAPPAVASAPQNQGFGQPPAAGMQPPPAPPGSTQGPSTPPPPPMGGGSGYNF